MTEGEAETVATPDKKELEHADTTLAGRQKRWDPTRELEKLQDHTAG